MDNNSRHKGSFVDHRRKSLTLNNIFIDDHQKKLDVEKKRHSIKSYLESLEKEKQDWKSILREKKTKCKEYENQYNSLPLTVTKTEVEKFITSDDEKFLNSKPNYLEMIELVKTYIDAISYLNKFKSDVIDYYHRVYNELEIDKMSLVEEMSTDNLCEICNAKNCQMQEHKFII